jgi:hypothetical protein
MIAVRFAAAIVLGRVATDCEMLHTGLVRQPVNAYSSLALLGVGLWILSRAARQQPGARGELAAFGVGMTSVGVGSLLLHGPAPWWALWFHDLSGLAVPLLVVVLDLGLLLGWSFRGRLLVVAAGLVLLALELAAVPSSTVPIALVIAPAAGLSEAAAIRFGFRPRPHREWSARTIAWLIAGVALALASGAYLLGRSGSPLCHPESGLQLHAVWHVLVAVSAAAFAYAAFERNPEHDAATRARGIRGLP